MGWDVVCTWGEETTVLHININININILTCLCVYIHSDGPWPQQRPEEWDVGLWNRESLWKCELADLTRMFKREDLARHKKGTNQILSQHCANTADPWAQQPGLDVLQGWPRGTEQLFPRDQQQRGRGIQPGEEKLEGESMTWLERTRSGKRGSLHL